MVNCITEILVKDGTIKKKKKKKGTSIASLDLSLFAKMSRMAVTLILRKIFCLLIGKDVSPCKMYPAIFLPQLPAA